MQYFTLSTCKGLCSVVEDFTPLLISCWVWIGKHIPAYWTTATQLCNFGKSTTTQMSSTGRSYEAPTVLLKVQHSVITVLWSIQFTSSFCKVTQELDSPPICFSVCVLRRCVCWSNRHMGSRSGLFFRTDTHSKASTSFGCYLQTYSMYCNSKITVKSVETGSARTEK